ncbi:Lrp/AsnC family transcriptional regulator [bacterium]|nr:Lrp/AsnC family transcriptional regulator [bacterium]
MIDTVDLQIMKLLSANGRMSNSEIGRNLGISEATVRQRIKRLIDNGILKISSHVDPNEFPEIFIVVVGVILNILPEICLDKITSLPNVLFSFTVTGRYDIIAVFAVNSRQMLSEIVENQLHSIHGVSHTETFVVLKNFGFLINAEDYCELLHDGKSGKKK